MDGDRGAAQRLRGHGSAAGHLRIVVLQHDRGAVDAHRRVVELLAVRPRHPAEFLGAERAYVEVDGGGGVAHREMRQDRKSTRLNSSHVKISYAVFCLTKKK